jgi:elongation factor P--beta-lysine ligase
MELAEDVLTLFREVARAMHDTDYIVYNGKKIQFDSWEKITVSQAFEKYADIQNVIDADTLMTRAHEKGYVTEGFDYVDIWSQIYAQEIEPYLGKNGKPTLIYEYPRQLAATAQYDSKKKVAQRLEVYIEGIELGNCGNASTAKTNKVEEEKKLFHENALRKKLHRIEHKPDLEFAEVLTKMPPTAGIAIGVERLGMIFTGCDSIHDLQVISVR